MLENKTLYNEKSIHEAMKPLNRPMMIYVYIVTAILVGLAAYQIAVVGGNTGLLFGAVAIIVAVFNYMQLTKRLKNREQTYIQSVREKNGTDEYTNHIVIDEEKMHTADKANATEMYHRDIRSVDETRNLIMVRYKTGKLVIIDKNGFTRGTADEFKTILRKYVKVK